MSTTCEDLSPVEGRPIIMIKDQMGVCGVVGGGRRGGGHLKSYNGRLFPITDTNGLSWNDKVSFLLTVLWCINIGKYACAYNTKRTMKKLKINLQKSPMLQFPAVFKFILKDFDTLYHIILHNFNKWSDCLVFITNKNSESWFFQFVLNRIT